MQLSLPVVAFSYGVRLARTAAAAAAAVSERHEVSMFSLIASSKEWNGNTCGGCGGCVGNFSLTARRAGGGGGGSSGRSISLFFTQSENDERNVGRAKKLVYSENEITFHPAHKRAKRSHVVGTITMTQSGTV